MDLFKAAQRIPPRRIPLVRRYATLPVAQPLVLPKPPSGNKLAIGAFVVVALGVGAMWMVPSDPEPTPVPSRRPGPGGASAGPASHGASAPPADWSSSGGGGGGGGGVAPPIAIMPQNVSQDVVVRLKMMVYELDTKPTTTTTLTDRLALFEKYFLSLDGSDRKALFGAADFKKIEAAIRNQKDKGPAMLDRLMVQLKLVLF